ncbi:hypothetical protein H5410_014331 [Solanum commersonii]|uniref:Uncharacterized protein n=1 Tax=Solanum commersonii TaxID=4109 RepID=A0A9J5ZQX5_SOLCO|nr:hypothetical protein H5410_014331 [Solanum commersonii]
MSLNFQYLHLHTRSSMLSHMCILPIAHIFRPQLKETFIHNDHPIRSLTTLLLCKSVICASSQSPTFSGPNSRKPSSTTTTLLGPLQHFSYAKLCSRAGTEKKIHSIGKVILYLVSKVKKDRSDWVYPTASFEFNCSRFPSQ